MREQLQKHADKVRFGIVGCINTALDFGILFLLSHFGVPVLVANFISTTTAFSFSFIANKKFTFKSSGATTKKQIGLFLLVTLFGLWVLQPLIISLVKVVLGGSSLSGDIVLLGAKLAATVITLVWNYVFYSKVVFKTGKREV
jgi:putative flippase GtrA